MTEAFFPIPPEAAKWPLQMILKNMKADRGWLERARDSGEYDVDWLEIIEVLGGERRLVVDAEGEESGGRGDEIDIPAEVSKLFKELQDEKANMNVKDNSEKMSYFRTATALLEKLISLRERAQNVHQVGQFYTTVLAVMEETLNVDQIRGVRDRLHVAAGGVIA